MLLCDPSANIWTLRTSMNMAQLGHTALTLSNVQILIIGGVDNSGHLDSVELYAPVANTWSTKASLPGARFEHMVVTLSDRTILVVDGQDSSNFLNDANLYDPSTNA